MRTDDLARGAVIRARRERAYLSQRELAALAGCSFASVCNFEHGALPSPERSAVLARVLAALDEIEAAR
jgi:transcriptional regulator with XRE-family HTH domain